MSDIEYVVNFGEHPSIDDCGALREKLVRCRDCKFCMAYMAGAYCDYMAHAIELDGFCAWGERKEVDNAD